MDNKQFAITEPSQFLVENIHLLPRGKAFDVAMGWGRNAVFLAENGFDVEGVDISAEAIKFALHLASMSGVNIKAKIADLESEFYINKQTYQVIICFNYLQHSLMSQIKDGLQKGGVVVYETYLIDQIKFGKPTNPEHLLRYNELLQIFHDFRCLRYREGIFQGHRGPKAIAGIVAEKI